MESCSQQAETSFRQYTKMLLPPVSEFGLRKLGRLGLWYLCPSMPMEHSRHAHAIVMGELFAIARHQS